MTVDDPRTGSLDRLSRSLGWASDHLAQLLVIQARDADSPRATAEALAVVAEALAEVDSRRQDGADSDGSGIFRLAATVDGQGGADG